MDSSDPESKRHCGIISTETVGNDHGFRSSPAACIADDA